MKVDEIRCEQVQVELSARLDGEEDRSLSDAVDEHLDTCRTCTAHAGALAQIHRLVRVQEAARVPDQTPAIVGRARSTTFTNSHARWSYLRTATVAALVTLLVVASSAFIGERRPTDIASASEIITKARDAARRLEAFGARFVVVERTPARAARTSQIDIAYRAPETLRVDVRPLPNGGDGTPRRGRSTFITSETTTYIEQPTPCPRILPVDCSAAARSTSRLTTRRQPLIAPMPSLTDIVIPLETLAAADGLEVVDESLELIGHRTVRVRLPFWQGHALISAIRPATSAPFAPDATVDVWLDARDWFPLRFTVTERGADEPVLEATAVSVTAEPETIDVRPSTTPDHVVDAGFVEERVDGPEPAYTGGLEPYRSGRTADGHTVFAYARGLTWLNVVVGPAISPPHALIHSEVIDLPAAGQAFYEPASLHRARVVEIFDNTHHARLESNLSRDELLRVADSLPLAGRTTSTIRVGATKITRVALREVTALSFFEVPTLPSGYAPATATITRRGGRPVAALVRYADRENERADDGIVIAAVPRTKHLAPSGEAFVTYSIGENVARWSPLRGEVEWIDRGVYRSVRVAGLPARFAVSIASSM